MGVAFCSVMQMHTPMEACAHALQCPPTNLKLLPLQCDEVLTPASVLVTEVGALRGAGLSGRKAEYVLDLAAHYQDGRLSDERIAGWDPTTLERELCRVKGIGVWSVHMVNE